MSRRFTMMHLTWYRSPRFSVWNQPQGRYTACAEPRDTPIALQMCDNDFDLFGIFLRGHEHGIFGRNYDHILYTYESEACMVANAAMQADGAVFLLVGSSTMRGLTPVSASCSAIKKRCCWFDNIDGSPNKISCNLQRSAGTGSWSPRSYETASERLRAIPAKAWCLYPRTV